MAATGARIETYSYSDATAQWASTHTLGVSIGGATTVRHNAPSRLEDVLVEWQSDLEIAKPAGSPWALSYSTATRRVTIAAAAVFDLSFPGNVGPWLGFTAGSLAGQATYTGDSAPAGLVQCAGVTADMPEMLERVESSAIRHGRAYSYAWGKIDQWQVVAIVDRERYPWQVQRSLISTDPAGGWATTGRVRIFQSSGSTSAYSETIPSGYIDGFVASCETEPLGGQEQFLRLTMEIVRPTAATGLAEPTGLWGAMRYGWSPNYWLKISGIGTVWTERTVTQTLPTGFAAQSATLEIDGSAPVGSAIDRARGIGTGLPLQFKLRDSSAMAAYMRRPLYQTHLTAAATYSADSLTVKSTTGFPASGTVYLGLETISHTATTGTSFNTCSRGASESLAVAHKLAKAAQIVTDCPRVWQGRDVRLYAQACDPTGYPTGTTLAGDSEEVWRGRLSGQALRQIGAWSFTADALDRMLERKLAGKVSGKIIGFGTAIIVSPQWFILAHWEGLKSSYANECGPYIVKVFPFAALPDGTQISKSEAVGLIQAAWSAEVTAQGIGGHVSTELLVTEGPGVWGGVLTAFAPIIVAHVNLAFIRTYQSYWGGIGGAANWFNGAPVTVPITAQTVDQALPVGWNTVDDVTKLYIPGTAYNSSSCPIVQIDEGLFDLVPSSGAIQVNTKNTSQIIAYTSYSELGGLLYFSLKPKPTDNVNKSEFAGATVNVWTTIGPLSLEKLMLSAIQSSGTTAQGTYDTAPQGAGYGIAAVSEDSFTARDGQSGLAATVSAAGSSFADLFGGALALSQLAVTQKIIDGECVLALVETTPAGSGYVHTLTDYHLLHLDDDPIESVERLSPPNAIEVTRIVGAEQSDANGEADKCSAYDSESIMSTGQVTESLSIPAKDRNQLLEVVAGRSAVIFGSEPDCQAVTVRVVPWFAAQPGDLIYCVLTHPLLYSFSAAAPGYTGKARVVGREQELATGAVQLELLLEGRSAGSSLSPAALVIAFDVAGAATWIDVDAKYFDHFSAALAAAGTDIQVLHYTPGLTEGTGQRYTVRSATMIGGYCRLGILGQTGVFSLSTGDRSTLTLPASGAAYITAYQAQFAHADDGTRWT